MPLSAGMRLGPYEVITKIGEGGMGEVYRARDMNLGRDVAIKILPDTVAFDTERVARFRREPQLLAALNHPHIGAIYGLENSSGMQFLVLEFVDGESLGQKLAHGPLPVDEALALYYLNRPSNGKLIAVDVKITGTVLEPSQPKPLFDAGSVYLRHSGGPGYHAFSVSSDGQRFLIPRPLDSNEQSASLPIAVVMNWAAGIK